MNDFSIQQISGNKRIRVKFLGTYNTRAWLRQFPHNLPVWGDCEYIFDLDARDYDWLVVYNDLPSSRSEEILCCPQQQTLLVTTEPSSIKSYGRAFTAQFGYILTSQAAWALPHRNRIFSQPALQWFYGLGRERMLSYDQMVAEPPLKKNKIFSTVCSTKQQNHTLHNKRYKFTQALKKKIPIMDIYGHGVKEMDDKAESLNDYQYHLAIENYLGDHHWTEKLSDAFLGITLPFYFGCPNISNYFPEESFIPIDIDDVEGASEIIKRAIHDKEYHRRLPYILEARRRVLEQYNIFAVLTRQIEFHMNRINKSESLAGPGLLLSRRLLRKRHPVIAVQGFYEKCRSRILHALKT